MRSADALVRAWMRDRGIELGRRGLRRDEFHALVAVVADAQIEARREGWNEARAGTCAGERFAAEHAEPPAPRAATLNDQGDPDAEAPVYKE